MPKERFTSVRLCAIVQHRDQLKRVQHAASLPSLQKRYSDYLDELQGSYPATRSRKISGRFRSYRIEINSRKWMKPGKDLPSTLRKMVETWIEAHEQELIEQWENAQNNQPVVIVG